MAREGSLLHCVIFHPHTSTWTWGEALLRQLSVGPSNPLLLQSSKAFVASPITARNSPRSAPTLPLPQKQKVTSPQLSIGHCQLLTGSRVFTNPLGQATRLRSWRLYISGVGRRSGDWRDMQHRRNLADEPNIEVTRANGKMENCMSGGAAAADAAHV